ncbi:hypothetical protein L596_006394 [Steinernema carpocapsae]|uniref:Uncharacterized protein n=1 Tax=Steinernema carpocapsae TaxID=34508 RepID=A0A4U8V8M2_STECR|nr:hypothetical protein L596_006394 [Steinernema carpocapsae]
MTLLIPGVTSKSNKTFQVCYEPLIGTHFVLPEPHTCKLPDRKTLKNGTVTMYVPSPDFYRIPAVHCAIVERYRFNRNCLFGHGHESYSRSNVSVEECWQWNQTRTARGHPLVAFDEARTTFTSNITYKPGWSLVGTIYNVTNYVLIEGTVGTFDGDHLLSTLGEMGSCNPRSGSCIRSESTTVWEPPNYSDFMYHELHGTFEAFIDKDAILIERLQALFYFSKKHHYAKKFFGKNAWMTENNVVFTINNSTELDFAQDSESGDVPDEFPDLTPNVKEVNVRLQYMEKLMRETYMNALNNMWYRVCKVRNAQITATKGLLRLDPTTAVRMWTKRENVTARYAGDVVLVGECEPVEVEHVYEENHVNGTCYVYQPIQTTNNKVMFIVPMTNDLTPYSSIQDCNFMSTPIMKDGNKYATVNGDEVAVIQMANPQFYAQNRHLNLKFDAPPIFQSQINAFVSSLALLMERQRRLEELEQLVAIQTGNYETDGNLRGLKKFGLWLHDLGEETKAMADQFIEDYGPLIKKCAAGVGIAAIVIAIPYSIVGCARRSLPKKLFNTKDSAPSKKAGSKSRAEPGDKTEDPNLSSCCADALRHHHEVAGPKHVRKDELRAARSAFNEDKTTQKTHQCIYARMHSQKDSFTINIHVERKLVMSWIDVSLELSFCRLTFAQQLRVPIIEDEPVFIQLNSRTIKVSLKCELNMKIGKIHMKKWVLVALDHQCPLDILLGQDVRNDLGAVKFSFNRRYIKIGNCKLPFTSLCRYCGNRKCEGFCNVWDKIVV